MSQQGVTRITDTCEVSYREGTARKLDRYRFWSSRHFMFVGAPLRSNLCHPEGRKRASGDDRRTYAFGRLHSVKSLVKV